MKKPWYQTFIEISTWLLVGIFAMGGLLDSISNAITLINFTIALWTTLLFFILYSLLFFFFKKRQIKWLSYSGEIVTIIELSKKLKWSILGALFLLWIPIIFKPSPQLPVAKIFKPVFDTSDTRFKVLVLPFDKECDYQGKKYDIGNVICKRLEALNREDTLNLITHYLTDSISFTNFPLEDADSIMKYHHADQIIYGSYSLKECESGDADKICFNYLTNTSEWILEERQTLTAYKMVNFQGLESIRKGVSQEDIDYILYYIAGISAMKEKNFFKAIRRFQKIKSFKEDEKIQLHISLCYAILKDYPKARENYEKVIVNNPNQVEALINLGIISFNLKDFPSAKKYCEEAIKINPSNDVAWGNLGLLYGNLNDDLKAKECFQKAIQINPKKTYLWSGLGTAYLGLKDYFKAKACLEIALRFNPNDKDAWHNMGNTYRNLKDYAKAIESYEKTLKINPNDEEAWYNLGSTYRDLKDYLKAKECYEKALKINPEDEYAWANLGYIYSELKDYLKAKECLKIVVKKKPNYEKAWFNLGIVYGILKENQNSKKCFETVLKIDPNNGNAWHNLGNVWFDLKNYIEAKESYQEALKINSKNDHALYALGRTYSIERNKLQALIYLHKAIVLNSVHKSQAQDDYAFEWLWKEDEFIKIVR